MPKVVDHDVEFAEALAEQRADDVERLLMLEAIAVELIRVGNIPDARLTLLGIIEQDAAGRWRLIGNSWGLAQFFQIRDRSWRARNSAVEGRADQRGVPWATLTGWIEDELRPRGLLAQSAGPGRPRRGQSRYAPGPTPDLDFM